MYRAGIIGAGGVAGMGIFGTDPTEDIGEEPVDSSHAGGYAGTEGVELTAVADVDPGALDRFGEAWDVPDERRYPDHETMLEVEDLDVVSVCTPSMLHRDHVVDAARIGDPGVVWCEKPLACSVGAAREATEVCDGEGVELVVNHSSRFRRQHVELRDAIADGLLGDVQSAAAGATMELLRVGTHQVDLLTFLLDEGATRIGGYVTGENESAEHLSDGRRVDDAGGGGFFLTESGAFVVFDGTASRDVGEWFTRLNGTGGRLVQDDRGWSFRERTDDGHVERDPPTGGHDDDHERSFVNAAEHCVDLLDGDAENRSPGEDAVRTLEILVGFYVSEYTGGQVSVPFDRPLEDVSIESW